jgi:phage putative head morphogenesis protein, SPP1 gp7 family
MNLNPIDWLRAKQAPPHDPTRNQGGAVATSIRDVQALGIWHDSIGAWQPRTVSPWLYEALKEAIPMLDAGIGRMVTLDGILEVEGGNDALVAEIEEWMRNIPVNDVESGYQAFYASQGEELYEQGHGIAEIIYDAKGRDVIGLRVADSKGTAFVREEDRMRVFYRAPSVCTDGRPDGLAQVEAILQGRVRSAIGASLLLEVGYVELDPRQLVIAVNRPEADNPYGTSLLRSVPFVSQILLRMQNATGQVWTRFGDPSFHIHYGTKSARVTSADAQKRAETIARDLARAMEDKARGHSVDLATGAGMNDTITIDVIGAVSEALQIEMPAKHMIEQLVAAFGLPAWMLGVSWSQAAGIAEPQAELVLQDAKTRFARRQPGLARPIAAMLRARRRTWKPGDWDVVQRLPSITDRVKGAQAEFLLAQAALVRGNAAAGSVATDESPQGLDNIMRAARPRTAHAHAHVAKANGRDDDEPEPWAEDDPELPRIEAGTIAALLRLWRGLRDDVLRALGLTTLAAAGDDFVFDLAAMADLLLRGQGAITRMAEQVLAGSMRSYDRGSANAAIEIAAGFDDPAVQAAIAAGRERVNAELRHQGMALVRNGMARAYSTQIVAALASGEFDGVNPVIVADRLRQRFGAGDYNWERLARSEIAAAQVRGKRDMYRANGYDQYGWVAAPDACPICHGLADGGPYRLDDPEAPLPMTDSHPNCRCSIRAVS